MIEVKGAFDASFIQAIALMKGEGMSDEEIAKFLNQKACTWVEGGVFSVLNQGEEVQLPCGDSFQIKESKVVETTK